MIKYWISLLCVVVVFSSAEWLARHMLPTVPRSEDVPRNPYRFRGWPEFTRLGPAPDNHARIVWLSNSQAYAGELPANRIYVDKLERALTKDHVGGFKKIEVLNWSFDGVTSLELTILAAYLHSASPDLVVAAVGAADFSSLNFHRPISEVRTDIPRLITDSAVRRTLPPSFRRRHMPCKDVLTEWARDRCALLRFREFAWSWLDQRWSGLLVGLYAPSLNYHPWKLDRVSRRASLGSPPWRKRMPYQIDYGIQSRELLAEFLDLFAAIPARNHLVILTPRFLEHSDPNLAMDIAFGQDIQVIAQHRGIRVWDDRHLFGREAFFDGLHFHPPFHQEYCDRLMRDLPSVLQ
ncbi:MAG: hypothetical protein NZ740_01760 [Kiritimatiellae bacterium]|nr:hypothetical protein [Kiritimatiellia bacterium]MDW8457817.1 hypothetical protein [Verrucomicrobiota bacterium]